MCKLADPNDSWEGNVLENRLSPRSAWPGAGCVLLLEEVAWLAMVGGEKRQPQDSPCFLAQNKQ